MIVRDEIGEQLAAWGKVARITTRARSSGRPAVAAVGFVAAPDGSLVVAAGSPEAAWARNLEAEPRCEVTIEEHTQAMVAERLDGAEANAAIVGLILKYGTPSEGLGRGPAFRLRPVPVSRP